MFHRPARLIGALALSAALVSACAPISKYQGYTVLDDSPSTAKIGVDTTTSVRTKFGSPTSVSTFEPNIWYYMAQTTDQFGAYKPKLRQREIVSITFDKTTNKVTEVKTITAEEGRLIAYSDRETPTSGRQLNVFQQILGTLGSSMLPRTGEDDPGQIGRNGGPR